MLTPDERDRIERIESLGAHQVSNLTALPIILNSIIGTNMTLTMTNPALAASALDVTIYNEIYEGLGSPP